MLYNKIQHNYKKSADLPSSEAIVWYIPENIANRHYYLEPQNFKYRWY